MSNTIIVGISDLNIVKSPDILVTYALGSCVGICLYDNSMKIAGLSHIMLPSSELIAAGNNQPYRYADTAIVALIKKMELLGANRLRMKAKIAGGAQMFFASGNSSISNIGQRNVQAVKAVLTHFRIQIIADDTGKDFGRTVFFYAEDGSMKIKSATKGDWVL